MVPLAVPAYYAQTGTSKLRERLRTVGAAMLVGINDNEIGATQLDAGEGIRMDVPPSLNLWPPPVARAQFLPSLSTRSGFFPVAPSARFTVRRAHGADTRVELGTANH